MGGDRYMVSITGFLPVSSLGFVARRQIVLETPNKDQSLQETLICELMLDWYPRTVPSASYKTRGKVWPIVGILR